MPYAAPAPNAVPIKAQPEFIIVKNNKMSPVIIRFFFT